MGRSIVVGKNAANHHSTSQRWPASRTQSYPLTNLFLLPWPASQLAAQGLEPGRNYWPGSVDRAGITGQGRWLPRAKISHVIRRMVPPVPLALNPLGPESQEFLGGIRRLTTA